MKRAHLRARREEVLKYWIKAIVAAMAVFAMSVSAQSSRPHPPKPPFPQVELPQKARGERAVQLLGARLSDVAAWYGKSPAEFAAILRRDQMAWIDRSGRMLYEEEIEPPTGTAGSLTSTGNLAPIDQTFKLHSKPGSKRTIYLNFVGATLTNTVWNGSNPSITALPFDLDGVPYAFSTAELQRIQFIWQRVADDFAAFDVNVTTEPPAADALTRSGSADDTFGTTVLITQRTFYTCTCGGVAYIGVFDDTSNYYKPALVFYPNLGAGNEKYVAEAISHEAGHNMGLHHDGSSTTSYYQGHGEGATGWAPIMGTGYSRSLVQWSRGEYPNANNKEDDFAVMTTNGLPLRADDHGNTISAASRLGGTTANGTVTLAGAGIVERASDVDAFSFVAGPGTLNLVVNPAARSGNVDVHAELRDNGGALVASSNPIDGLSGTLTATTSSGGTFYVVVRGTGKGDLTTGYSSYGSVGEYSVAGTVPAPASQPPLAVLSAAPTSGPAPLAVSFSAAGSSDPEGQPLSIEWNFGDGSPAAYGATAVTTYSLPGTYTATVKVTDSAGLTSMKSVAITATSTTSPPVTNNTGTLSVAGITVSLSSNKSGRTVASANVTIKDGAGNMVGGASVTGNWSGAVSGSGSGITDSAGVAIIKSSRTQQSGSFVFTVTGVSLSGYQYVPANNTETSDSASR
jgi:PKD repeat protein